MKFAVFFSVILVLAACSENVSVPQKTEGLRPVVAITSTPNEAVEKDLVSSNAVMETENPWAFVEKENNSYTKKNKETQNLFRPSGSTAAADNFKADDRVEECIKTVSLRFGLADLRNSQILKDDIEIRFYLFSSLAMPIYQDAGVEKSVLLLKRSNSNWSAKIIRDTVRFRKNRSEIRNRIATNLNLQTLEWEALWQKLLDNEILTLTTDGEDGLGFDTWLYVVETKVAGNYRFFYFSSPSENSVVREERQFAKIFKTIAEEFNITDLAPY